MRYLMLLTLLLALSCTPKIIDNKLVEVSNNKLLEKIVGIETNNKAEFKEVKEAVVNYGESEQFRLLRYIIFGIFLVIALLIPSPLKKS